MIYVIINTSDLDSVDFSQVIETAREYLRYNLDGSKTFVKFEGDTPSFLDGKTQYSYEEIMAILQDYDLGWIEQDPE